jgi:3-oxoacyl-[acyl-carrier protein] reductase
MSLEDKVAVVTGGSGGLGRVHCLSLAGAGCDVAVIGHSHLEKAEEVVREIQAIGRRALAVKMDVADLDEVQAGVKKVEDELGPVDILVNNAALLRGGGRIQKTTVEDWKNLIKIDLDGPWYWIRELWDQMVERQYGRIVNISSIAGVQGGFGQANYSVAKAGVVALAKTAALEGARSGITANTVTLGVVDTSGGKILESETFQRIVAQVAMRKMGEPIDVATLVAFLVSEQCKYITGQNIHVMGGLDLFTY